MEQNLPSHNEPINHPDDRSPNRWLYLGCALIGGIYGLTIRLAASWQGDILRVMSMGFIFFMPLALGCIVVFIAELKRPQLIRTWIWLPWLSVVVALAGTWITLLEGLICIVMFLPIGLVLASVGGLMGGLAARYVRSRRTKSLTMACILILPFLSSPWEKQIAHEWESRRVKNVIDI